MKKTIITSLLFFYLSTTFAGIKTDYRIVNQAILQLGLELNDFSRLWPFYCNEKWTKTITPQQASENSFISNLLLHHFLKSELVENKLILKQGETCKSLLEYYFDNKYSAKLTNFIKKDKTIIKKYGFSSIDLFQFPYNFQGNYVTNNPTPGHSKLMKRLIRHFTEKNVFNIKSISPHDFHLSPSEQFKKSHNILTNIH